MKIKMFMDNQSIINLANHSMSHGRSKHTELQPIDISIKPLKRIILDSFKDIIRMRKLADVD